MSEIEKTELVKRIKKAFKDVSYPGRKIGDKEELRDFLGKTWKDLTPADLNRNDTLIYFNKAGLQYYLPFYLTMVLTNPDKVSSNVREAIVRELGYKLIDENLCEYFTKEQQNVILDFFERYESIFPLLSPVDKSRRQIEQAINYWRTCS